MQLHSSSACAPGHVPSLPLARAHGRALSAVLVLAAAAVALGCSGGDAPGLGNPATPGGGSGGSGVAGSSSTGGSVDTDPYAIPTTPPAPVLTPTPRIARLSRTQWANSVRDLLSLTDIADVESGVSGDPLNNFDTEVDSLYVTEQLRQQLAVAAEKLAEKATATDAALAALVPTGAPADAAGKANAFITAFGRRAFRRPLTPAEVTSHQGLFNQGTTLYPGTDAFKAGARLVIDAMLQSPHFLYRTELGTAAPGAAKVPLDNHEVATKLALALTNTMPDAALFAAADAGKLSTPEGIAEQAKRLLDSERGTVGLRNFNFQVYRLGAYDGIQRDATMFPEFKPTAPAAMRREVLQFIDWVFASGKGVKDFYTAPVGFVNESLAPLYGLTGTFGPDLVKVDLDPKLRSGLLTQPGFLTAYAKGADPDIIHRGVFIATRLLCKELPAPDPRATALIDLKPNMTNRERVELTTGKGTCGEVCHGTLLNALGYGFEHYDAIGRYRTMDYGKPVDAADSYRLDGEMKSFNGGVELSHALAEAKETHHCYVKNMLTYMHGRPVLSEEEAIIDYYARLSRAGKLTLRDMELAIVTSEAFLNRLP